MQGGGPSGDSDVGEEELLRKSEEMGSGCMEEGDIRSGKLIKQKRGLEKNGSVVGKAGAGDTNAEVAIKLQDFNCMMSFISKAGKCRLIL